MRILINKNWKKYIFVFFATCAVFATGWYLSTAINNRKISDLQDTQNKIATDILSSETQFDLLQELTCDLDKPIFSDEISTLADKISYSEKNLQNTDEILALKKQYSILEIKDFLLSKRIAERCNKKFQSILYFYGTKESCPDCVKQAESLDVLKEKNKSIHIYAFDYTLDLSIVKALKSIYKIKDSLPALVVNGITFDGYQNIDKLKSLIN